MQALCIHFDSLCIYSATFWGDFLPRNFFGIHGIALAISSAGSLGIFSWIFFLGEFFIFGRPLEEYLEVAGILL